MHWPWKDAYKRMEKELVKKQENTTLDLCKFIACLLVAAVHLPTMFSTERGEVFYNQWFFRFCVPLFFVSTGYYFQKAKNQRKSIGRVTLLFCLSYLLYLPLILEGVGSWQEAFSRLRWALVIGYEHLWYLSAALEGMLIWYFLRCIPSLRKLLEKVGTVASVLLLLLGALLDEHYKLSGNALLRTVGDFLSNFGGPRNVVFMGFPLLYLGGTVARQEEKIRKIPTWTLLLAWVLCRGLGCWECRYLYANLGATNWDADLTFWGIWPGLILFCLTFRWHFPISETAAKWMRKLSEYVYVLHPLVGMFLGDHLLLSPWGQWTGTIAMCCLLTILLEKQFRK